MELHQVFDDLFEQSGEDAVRHLFTVAASVDSMVLGETADSGTGETGALSARATEHRANYARNFSSALRVAAASPRKLDQRKTD